METLIALAPQGRREEWLVGAIAFLLSLFAAFIIRLSAPRKPRLGLPLTLLMLYEISLSCRELLDDPWAESVFGILAILFLSLAVARLSFLLVFDVLLARQRREPIPRIVRDLSQGGMLFVAAIAALRTAGVEPSQLLATSALLSVGAGLALQETLGNLFAGLSIQTERPFQVGDWIEVHSTPNHIGKVREINWRATRLHTLDNVDVVVPNGLLAKATLTNYDQPHNAARRSIYFYTPYSVPPRLVQETVLSAIRGSTGMLAKPEPSIVTFGFDESGVRFWLRFFLNDMSRRDAIDGEVRDRVWYSLSRAGIPFSVPNRSLEIHQKTDHSEQQLAERALEDRLRSLREQPLFSALSPEELFKLGQGARTVLFAPREVVIRQGDAGDQMFVVRRGELVVQQRTPSGREVEVGSLNVGDFFGEMSVLTGEVRRATISTKSACELLALDREAFRALLAEHPEIAQEISARVMEREAKLGLAGSVPELPAGPTDQVDLLGRMRRFFGLNR